MRELLTVVLTAIVFMVITFGIFKIINLVLVNESRTRFEYSSENYKKALESCGKNNVEFDYTSMGDVKHFVCKSWETHEKYE